MAEESGLGGGRYQEILPGVAGSEGSQGDEEEAEGERGSGHYPEILQGLEGNCMHLIIPEV